MEPESDKDILMSIINADMTISPERLVIDCPFCKGLGGFEDIERNENGEIIYEGDTEVCSDCEGTGLLRVRDFVENNDLSLEMAYDILRIEANLKASR